MGNKILKSFVVPYLRIGIIALIVFALGLLYYNVYAGMTALLITGALLLYFYQMSRKRIDLWEEYAKTMTSEMEDILCRFVYYNSLPLCVINSQGIVTWFNQKFPELYEEVEMLDSNIYQLSGLKYGDLIQGVSGEKHILVNRKDKTYRVMSSFANEGKEGALMLYWMDVTNLETLKDLYKDEKLCYAYIDIDNYDELIAATPDERKSVIASQIETEIRQWAARMSATVVRYKSGRYFIAFEHKYFEKLEAGKFSILDDVRGIETDGDFPPSLSIGIGVGGKNLVELEEFAGAALDLALGRGGDQAVVKRKNKIEYYGGKLQTVEKRNKGKSRIMAHALRQMIDQSGKVIIMGHRNPDMDSFGSSLGISRIVKNRNKEGAILINSYSSSLMKIYKKAKETGHYHFVSSEEAKNMVDKDTLLVVVDTHRPNLLDCPELLSMTDKIVVIDHHRKSEDSIENATLTYMEAYASSASELITEILQYIGDGKKMVEKLEAEALLAGITVDTKSFSIKTGVRTFEAASWLRRNGADTASVRQYFQTDMDSFKLKAEIIADAEILLGGFALSSCEGHHPNVHIITSQAADELLNIQDIRASFVVGSNEDGITVVSARSLGEVNVQTIMEKLGGGGHLATAGAQSDKSVEETLEEIRELIREIE